MEVLTQRIYALNFLHAQHAIIFEVMTYAYGLPYIKLYEVVQRASVAEWLQSRTGCRGAAITGLNRSFRQAKQRAEFYLGRS